jgi:molybdenum cofactor synthesis domain-containing protein
MAEEIAVTAAILVIGDEILSGRTKDRNIGYIADYLGQIGIDLREVRIVPDVEDEIVGALNALRRRYSYVFTTGGIGPTHDDITADAVAKAFGVPISEDPRALALLLERIKPEDLNAARRRMARIPQGGELVENKISKAPGFIIGNVIVMAGVPSIMQAMLDGVAPRLKTGAKMLVETVEAGNLPEGLYAADLAGIAERHKGVSIGSYPAFVDGRFRNSIVLRSKDEGALAAAIAETRALVDRLSRERRSA